MATTLAACELSGYSKSSQTFLCFSLSGNGLSSSLIKPSSSLRVALLSVCETERKIDINSSDIYSYIISIIRNCVRLCIKQFKNTFAYVCVCVCDSIEAFCFF